MTKAHPDRARVRSGTNLERAHLLNQRVVLETVRLNEPVSRIEIARLTGLTNQTVFNIVEDLQQIGLIQNFGQKTAERGQPAKLFEINADAAFSIGLHMERDHIAAVLVDFKGVIRSRTYRGRFLSTPEEALKQVYSSIGELRQANRRRRIWGLGIALPGPIDFRYGKVVFSPNFPGWEQVNVRDYFKKKTGLRVLIDNDATAAAIGESWYGAGRHLDSFVYIYVGVGVGGGIIVNGRPYRGFRGGSGEVGHIIVDRGRNARPCGCGKKGCLEAYLSLTALAQRLTDSGIAYTRLSQLLELYEEKNKVLLSWLNAAAFYLAEMMDNLNLLFDPEAFVIGGHLPGPLLTFLIEHCTNIIGKMRRSQKGDFPRVVQGQLQDEAAALGAAVLPIDDLIAPNYERITRGDHPSLLDIWDFP
ncbi:MAG TPA: ROK family transcriptional regulator [Chthoniobacterales bacterium]|nr:ROK family transcriptional regulator [Chthoniobacterales bacterium]